MLERTGIDSAFLTAVITPHLSEYDFKCMGASHPKGQTKRVLNPGDGYPSLTFQKQKDGKQYMTAGGSIPGLFHGHNALLQTSQSDIDDQLEFLAALVNLITWGLKFDPLSANVTAVHFTRDIKIGRELIAPVLRRLESRQLPRFRRIRFDHGVEWKQKGVTIQTYLKYHEVYNQIKAGTISYRHHNNALQASDGVLRVESRHIIASLERMRRKGICKTRRAIDVLTAELSNRVIDEFLAKIQFDDAVNSAEPNKVLDRLIEACGVRVAMRLNGFLIMLDSYGHNFWEIRSLKFPRTTYFNYLRECRAAGVWEA